jgi:hypothetical protein
MELYFSQLNFLKFQTPPESKHESTVKASKIRRAASAKKNEIRKALMRIWFISEKEAACLASLGRVASVARMPPDTYSHVRSESMLDHVLTTPAAQELLFNDEHRSGASMCSACSRSAAWLLALMKSAGWLPNHVIALEAL